MTDCFRWPLDSGLCAYGQLLPVQYESGRRYCTLTGCITLITLLIQCTGLYIIVRLIEIITHFL